MLLELDATDVASPTVACAAPKRWTVLVPFFNERELLPATLASLAAQTVRARVILIDNGSTDGSAALAAAECMRLGLDHLLMAERRPGKVAALATGLAWVRTPFVATCDADTWYPADYLAEAERLFARDDAVVAGAFFAPERAAPADRARRGRKTVRTARLLRRQCHTGGAGQAFRTAALRRAGGFDAGRWGYVLEDHEIVHRVLKLGAMAYGERFWCSPSPRERNRASIRWTLGERLLYAVTAPWAGDWFFYRFLASRLRSRQLTSDRIRERPFQGLEGFVGGTPYPVCG